MKSLFLKYSLKNISLYARNLVYRVFLYFEETIFFVVYIQHFVVYIQQKVYYISGGGILW